MRDGDRRRWWDFAGRKQLLWMIAGLAGGLAVAGGLALLMNYWLEPVSTPELWGLEHVSGERFEFWYAEESPAIAGLDDLRQDLETNLVDLVEILDVSEEDIPFPITVFVHESVGAMKSAILRRKSMSATTIYGAAFDLLVGENPRGPLAEVVLAYGWGDCFAQPVYVGTLLYARDPERNYHLAVRAAPEKMRHSVSDLVNLEIDGEFQTTLFQRVNAPTASRMMVGLGDIAEFLAINVQELGSPGDLISLESASLVKYLIEQPDGVARMKEAWGPGSTANLLARYDDEQALDDLTAAWHSMALAVDSADPAYAYMRAYYLYESGDFEAAHETVAAWTDAELTSDDPVALACRASLGVGENADALRFAGMLSEPGTDFARLAEHMADWQRLDADRMTILAPGGAAALEGHRARLEPVIDRLYALAGRSGDADRIFVFVHPDEASRDLAAVLVPRDERYQNAVHVTEGGDRAYDVAFALLPSVMGSNSPSTLLRTGIASTFLRTPDELTADACQLLEESRWFPLTQLDVGTVSREILEIESALVIQYIEDVYGVETVRAVWSNTSSLGGLSLDTALQKAFGQSRREIEKELLFGTLACE